MKIKFLDIAQAEFNQAIAYYNEESEGLGYEFALEIKRTIDRIVQHPEAWHPLSPRTRRCRTNRFPYGIIYQIRSDTVLIVAIMHLHRDPISWKQRVS